jgi:heme/copper-type cytochrome/quinol oxidase subunit 2
VADETVVVEVEVAGGASSIAGQTVNAKIGQRVLIQVASDVADEVHLHGYDLKVEVAAGSSAEIEFVADIPGVFEVELEEAGLLLFELAVSP